MRLAIAYSKKKKKKKKKRNLVLINNVTHQRNLDRVTYSTPLKKQLM